MNFQNLYSSLAIILDNLLSLKTLFPIKEIFLILALSPKSTLIIIFIKLLFKDSDKISIFGE